jgi:hypothetical protein
MPYLVVQLDVARRRCIIVIVRFSGGRVLLTRGGRALAGDRFPEVDQRPPLINGDGCALR